MMTLKQAEEALAKLIDDKGLSAAEKQQAIFNIAKELSADIPGTKTVLYSGYVDGKKTENIALSMYDDSPNIRIINKTGVDNGKH